MEDEFFSINEVSTYLKIPKSTLYKLSETGKIPSVKIGKQLRFRKSSLDKWVSKQERESLIPDSEPPLALAITQEAKPKDVLIIDDDHLLLKSIAKFLKIYGYNTESVLSGIEALEKVKNTNFDLIIADVRMAGLDGIETIEKIREFYIKSKKTLPQEIIITGYMDTIAEKRASRLGIEDYIYKPFAISDFISVVKKKIDFSLNLN